MRNPFLLFVLLLSTQLAFANQYRVEIAVFEKSVGFDYFHNIENVKLAVDVNNLHRYYLGDFADLAEAETAKKDAMAKGRKYARIIDLVEERANCAMSCKAPLYVENIFFDFDRSNLRSKSRSDLDDLANLMNDNLDYKVDLSAHTDARGSLEYNIALSQRRANAAKDYLVAKGISTNRIRTSEFGETAPIAINEINGQDSPSGRQYNRRVVVRVVDANGKSVSNVVKPIDVPTSLKIK